MRIRDRKRPPGHLGRYCCLPPVAIGPPTAAADDPRFAPEAITGAVTRLLAVKQQQDALAAEQKELHEQLRLAYLRGDLLRHLPAGQDGRAYQITPDLMPLPPTGPKQLRDPSERKQLECTAKAPQIQRKQM